MKKIRVGILTSAVAIVLATAISATAVGSSFIANKLASFKLDNQLKASNATFDFEYNGVKYKNEYERLLAEDGFIYGMDMNWFGSFSRQTVSVGNNNITGITSDYDAGKFEKDLWNIKALGFNAVNIWMFQDGVGGLLFDDEGLVTGLDDNFIKNTKSMLELARKVGVDIVPSIQPHGKSNAFYLGTSKESPNEIGYKYLRFYWDEEGRKEYLDNAVKPLCDILKDYQDVIPIINLTVENGTNMINDIDTGMFNAWQYGSLTWENFASFINDLNAEVKAVMPNEMTSVEDVAWDINFVKYNDVDIDLIGRNGYDNNGSVPDSKKLFVEKPLYLGEFNTFEGEDGRSEETKTAARISFYPNAVEQGYIGGFFFDWDRAEGGELGMFTSATSDNLDALKSFAIPLANTIRDLKYQHKEISVDIDKPEMFYYTGGNIIYFLGSRAAEKYTLQRKTNGGNWETIKENIDPDNDTLVNGLFKCTDNNLVGGNMYSYRVIAYGADGKTATSDPSNEAEFFVPPEMLEEGSFEEGSFANGPWYTTIAGGRYTIGEYSTEEARTGEYSLHIDWGNGVGNIGQGGSMNYLAQWKNDLKPLTPGARYELSFWYKSAVRGKGSLSITARDKDNNNLCWLSVSTTEEGDETWHKATRQFIAPDDGEVCIVLMNSAIDDLTVKCYLDDFSVKEVR